MRLSHNEIEKDYAVTTFRLSLPQKTSLPALIGDENNFTTGPRSGNLYPSPIASSMYRIALALTLLAASWLCQSTVAQSAPLLTRLTCAQSSITGNATDACTVILNAPASSAALKIALSSNRKALVAVPASIVVPAGSTSATFSASVNYSQLSNSSVTLSAYANGSRQACVLNLIAATRALSVNTTTLSFGTLPVNTAATMPLTLVSSGNLPVALTSAVSTGAGFTVASLPLPQILSPGQSVTLNAIFKPADTSAVSGQIAIATNANVGSPTLMVSLSGRGITSTQLTVSTTRINFGTVSVGSSATQEVLVTSSGTAPVTLSSASLSGSGFNAASSVSLPVTLSPGQSAIGYMTFEPTSAGSATASLTIANNSSTPSIVVTLSGTGVGATHVVNLAWDAPLDSPVPVAGYHVYRSAGNGSSYVLLTPSPNSQTTYADANVQNGQTYSYVVKSVDGAGDESPASNSTDVAIP